MSYSSTWKLLVRGQPLIGRGRRVTARGTFLPLQLFLHQNPDGSPSPRGWRVRCAVDIAKGTFISVFTGHVGTKSETASTRRYALPLDHFLRWAPSLCGDDNTEIPIPVCPFYLPTEFFLS